MHASQTQWKDEIEKSPNDKNVQLDSGNSRFQLQSVNSRFQIENENSHYQVESENSLNWIEFLQEKQTPYLRAFEEPC